MVREGTLLQVGLGMLLEEGEVVVGRQAEVVVGRQAEVVVGRQSSHMQELEVGKGMVWKGMVGGRMLLQA